MEQNGSRLDLWIIVLIILWSLYAVAREGRPLLEPCESSDPLFGVCE